MKLINTYNDLYEFCGGLNETERAMPVQVGLEAGLILVRSAGHVGEVPDAGSNTLILETCN